jgi:hypothetical protein
MTNDRSDAWIRERSMDLHGSAVLSRRQRRWLVGLVAGGVTIMRRAGFDGVLEERNPLAWPVHESTRLSCWIAARVS